MNIKELIHNKVFIYTIAVGGILAIASAAVIFSNGELFKGEVPIMPPTISCSGKETSQIGDQVKVVWTAVVTNGLTNDEIDWKSFGMGIPMGTGMQTAEFTYTVGATPQVEVDLQRKDQNGNLNQVATNQCSLTITAIPNQIDINKVQAEKVINDFVGCSAGPNPVEPGKSVTWTAIFPGEIPVSYNWSGTALIDNTHAATITSTPPLGPTQYTVTVEAVYNNKTTKTGNCSVDIVLPKIVPKTVTCKAEPSPAIAGQPVTLTAVTTGIAPITYVWNGDTKSPNQKSITFNADLKATNYSGKIMVDYGGGETKSADCSFDIVPDAAAKAAADAIAKAAADAIVKAAADKAAADAVVKAAADAAVKAAADAAVKAAADAAAKAAADAAAKLVPPPLPPAAIEQSNPAQDVISCKMYGNILVLDAKASVIMYCDLSKTAQISAEIVQGAFDPKNLNAVVLKNLISEQSISQKKFVISWNGYDQYDSQVPPGEYSFVVSGRPDKSYDFDYSIQKFTVLQSAPPQVPGPPAAVIPPANYAQLPALHGAAPEAPPVAPAQPSQCPGLNYPTDIANHWAESIIKFTYDKCLLKGYADGTFRPDQPVTRFEAVKMALVSKGIPPHAGCYTANCGAGWSNKIFPDIANPEQGPYIRAAADSQLVTGIAGNFMPNAQMTRGEAASLVAKLLNIQPQQGCYTADCGAGQPGIVFQDIFHYWQGSYIRPLADKGILHGVAPGKFEPDRSITRAELAKMLFGELATPAATPSPAN